MLIGREPLSLTYQLLKVGTPNFSCMNRVFFHHLPWYTMVPGVPNFDPPHSIELHGVSQGHPLSQAPPGTQLGSIQGRQRALPLFSPSGILEESGETHGETHWLYLDILA